MRYFLENMRYFCWQVFFILLIYTHSKTDCYNTKNFNKTPPSREGTEEGNLIMTTQFNFIANLNNIYSAERTWIEKNVETIENETIALNIVEEADFSGRNVSEGSFEMAATAVDKDGNKYRITWIFEDDGRDLDQYDYSADNIDNLVLLAD